MLSFEMIMGKKIVGSGGHIVGEVKGATINMATWQVAELYVKLSDKAADELGFKKRFRSSMVCIPTHMIQAVGDVMTMSMTLKELSESHEVTECKIDTKKPMLMPQ